MCMDFIRSFFLFNYLYLCGLWHGLLPSKDTCCDEIGLCTRNIDMIINSIVDAIKSANIKRNIIFKLPSYNSDHEIEMTISTIFQILSEQDYFEPMQMSKFFLEFEVPAMERHTTHLKFAGFEKTQRKGKKNGINLAWGRSCIHMYEIVWH